MQAQPVFSFNARVGGIRSYEIKWSKYVRDSNKIQMADIPKEVLNGWFAHELGHLVDYEGYSDFRMIGWSIGHVLNENFKRETEHASAMIASNKGFDKEIIAA